MGKREVVIEVRSSELETRLSSSDDPIEARGDIVTSGHLSSGRREIGRLGPFMPLGKSVP